METQIFEYRGLTCRIYRTDDPMEPPCDDPAAAGLFETGDYCAGVLEWRVETGASLSNAGAAAQFVCRAVDRVLDDGAKPAEALARSGVPAIPMALGAVVAPGKPVPRAPADVGQTDAVLLMQARYVLRSLDVERPGCGYAKMAAACEAAATRASGREPPEQDSPASPRMR